jgi:hypothetical protein
MTFLNSYIFTVNKTIKKEKGRGSCTYMRKSLKKKRLIHF